MSGAEIVAARLATIAGVTALVASRIYQLQLPQRVTLPAIRITLVSRVEPVHLRGLTGLRRERVQVDCYADTGDALGTARQIADAAYGACQGGEATGLAGWAGTFGSPAVRVDLIEPLGRNELFEPDELRQAIVSDEYYVNYRA